MGRGGQSGIAGGPVVSRGDAERAELGAARLLNEIQGWQLSDVEALSVLRSRLEVTADANVADERLRAFVMAAIAITWTSEADAVSARLLGAAVLARPRRRGLHRPRLAEVVTVLDWETLTHQRELDVLGRWGEIDWALWLNGLIRQRCEVERRLPPTGGQPQGNDSDTARLARTIFFAGS